VKVADTVARETHLPRRWCIMAAQDAAAGNESAANGWGLGWHRRKARCGGG